MTTIKYIPQAWFNMKRRSTLGWSISNVLLDITGGLASFVMMALQSLDQGKGTPCRMILLLPWTRQGLPSCLASVSFVNKAGQAASSHRLSEAPSFSMPLAVDACGARTSTVTSVHGARPSVLSLVLAPSLLLLCQVPL